MAKSIERKKNGENIKESGNSNKLAKLGDTIAISNLKLSITAD